MKIEIPDSDSSLHPHPSSPRLWYAVDVSLSAEACEAVEYALMEAGALGTESKDESVDVARVYAYFPEIPEIEKVRAALLDALRLYDLPSSSVREMSVKEVEDRDWLGEWKKSWRAVTVGRFIVAPPWGDLRETGQIVIRIEPGMAFGTGTHETTRLCLAAIEKYFEGGSFLDVGTGTGILGIAAAKLFPPARIEACDTDADAVRIARENAQMNGVAERIEFRVGTIDETTASADMVCANLTADVIVPMLPVLTGATCNRLILSGILETQTELVLSRLGELGITEPLELMSDGEWIAMVV
ncbi:MAG TPA: 50S ribosomal protein L11 methyltransferase [Pyrinomonadaceae bacterium]|nr:50S ribosomal protein L11 methyltransferase [Pyrinomonadaceae bacterium]